MTEVITKPASKTTTFNWNELSKRKEDPKVADFCGKGSSCDGYILKGSYTTTTDAESNSRITVKAELIAPEEEDY
jgi:hypothetical protein